MARITRKTFLETIDGTPKKRLFLSIISDYDLKTGICELVDNAIDHWTWTKRSKPLTVDIRLDADRQYINVTDNAGGLKEDQAVLLIAPGATLNDSGLPLIGVFGVGGKRAGVALGELVEIRTHAHGGKSFQVDLTKEWIQSDDWDLDIYEIPAVPIGTTSVEISKVRQSFDDEDEDVEYLMEHLGHTYGSFIGNSCKITINDKEISSLKFDSWAYPPSYLPRHARFSISPVSGDPIEVSLSAGLILDRDREAENYGVYFYCNDRLILKELRTRDVGYYVSTEAGVPHPDASLSRVIVRYTGAAESMPWNSSKNGLNFSHPAFTQIRRRIIDFSSYFTSVSRRLKNDWPNEVFSYKTGTVQEVNPNEALSTKKKILPKLPPVRHTSRLIELRQVNSATMKSKPWTVGLVEAMAAVQLISKQNMETANRIALILLDSNLEIAMKEFIVTRPDLFPPHIWTNKHLMNTFANRTNAIKEVQGHAKLSKETLSKINHYYSARNSLIHQRATVQITDSQVQDYSRVVEAVLKKLFKLKFPA